MPTSPATKPNTRPQRPHFSSGPCAKHPGWSLGELDTTWLGRSHRAGGAKTVLKDVIDRTHALLELPADYRVAIVPASNTGAFEMAMWSVLGARGVAALGWENFGLTWTKDILDQLQITDVARHEAPYGAMPDLAAVDSERDIVFTWNGTTSGVRVPNGDWIASDRAGLTLADATSAAFAQRIAWDKVDIGTFSWQKALGGEAQHGIIVLSPRAVERLTTYTPPWPMPKVFRLAQGGKLIDGVFEGLTINTPSMLCVADYAAALDWAERIGGLDAMCARADAGLELIAAWVAERDWVDFLAADPATRSNTSICLQFTAPEIAELPEADRAAFVQKLCALLEAEDVAYDIKHHAAAPAGLRIWTGATVDTDDVAALLPWLDWAYRQVLAAG